MLCCVPAESRVLGSPRVPPSADPELQRLQHSQLSVVPPCAGLQPAPQEQQPAAVVMGMCSAASAEKINEQVRVSDGDGSCPIRAKPSEYDILRWPFPLQGRGSDIFAFPPVSLFLFSPLISFFFFSLLILQKAFQALCHSTHLYGRRLVLEWADTEETLEALRRKTAQHFHGNPCCHCHPWGLPAPCCSLSMQGEAGGIQARALSDSSACELVTLRVPAVPGHRGATCQPQRLCSLPWLLPRWGRALCTQHVDFKGKTVC